MVELLTLNQRVVGSIPTGGTSLHKGVKMTGEFRQERPVWCQHKDCKFKRISQDKICGGELSEPQPHDPGGPPVNTHRFCLRDALPKGEIFDLQVHNQDLESMRWVFDALDGKKTSWMSQDY